MGRESVLKAVGEITFEEENQGLFSPCSFCRPREGLWVSPDFKKWVLPAITRGPVEDLNASGARIFELMKIADENVLTPELPPRYAFPVLGACYRVLQMIEGQFNGEKGILLTNRNQNIFYVDGEFKDPILGASQTLAISATFSTSPPMWLVDATWPNSAWWGKGHRIFVFLH